MKRMRLVEVCWVDTVALDHGWNPPEHYRDRADRSARDMRTAGYLVTDTKERVDVAHSRMETNGNIDRIMSIPRSQIVSIRDLK